MLKKLVILIFMISALSVPSAFAKNEKKMNMSYLYTGQPQDYTGLVDRTKGAVNTVSPSYFDLNKDGSLKITDKFDQTFVQEMKRRNVAVIPFLSNHWDQEIGRQALANKEKLADDIVRFVKQYDLQGVNVDLEGLNEQDKDALTAFIRVLRQKMPVEKTVSIAVAANPKGYTKGWHGSYDYENLAKYADFLMLMTYDESWYGSVPGTVAGIQFVEQSVKYALNQNVAANKIVLGLPFYGRLWRLEDIPVNGGTIAPGSINGNGFSLSKVAKITDLYQAKSSYDKNLQSPVATFEIKKGDKPFFLNSWDKNPLPAGRYVLWYENNQSIKSKIELVHKYNLKGVGSWSLGQENVQLWDNFDIWMQGLDYKDVPFKHWAQESIARANDQDWMGGRTETLFFPEGKLTRAETAVILVRFLGLSNHGTAAQSFSDVSNAHWASGAIDIVATQNLMSGRSVTQFAPNDPVSRQEMAVILSRVLQNKQIQQTGNPWFSDMKEGSWSYTSVMDMANKGIFAGFEDQTFRPQSPITRAQMAALLNRIDPLLQ